MGSNGLSRAPSLGISEEIFEDDTDYEIDWALVYDFTEIDLKAALQEYGTLINDLEGRNLQVQVRHGYGTTVLVLLRVPRNILGNEIYRSRVKDWLFGITHTRPVGNSATIVEADTPAEALRSVFHLVSWTTEQGGAGITAGVGKWERITASFPPHAGAANARLLAKFASKTVLTSNDLDRIRNLFGEKVAFYYAFIQSYSLFLVAPSILGVSAYLFLPSYSVLFAILLALWSITFVEYWRRQEVDFSLRWDVKGVEALKVNRPQYRWDREFVDPTTGEKIRSFSAYKRLWRQALFVPFALVASVALGTALALTFLLEAYLNDIYGGPFREHWPLGFLPTILLSMALPYITQSLEDMATGLSDFENYRTADEYELAQVQKSFILNFVTSFLPIFLTAYIYVPYGATLMPDLLEAVFPARWLSNASFAGVEGPRVAAAHVDPSRLQEEIIGLSVMAQLVSFGEENVLPYLQRRFKRLYRRWNARHHYSSFERCQRETSSSTVTTPFVDAPHEKHLLARLRNEADAETYDVQADIMEMVVQFGYLTLFSCSWPLMPLGFLLNNWVELRGDFWKLTRESRRPPPIRTVGIGACLGALDFLTWLGAMSAAAICTVYHSAQHMGKLDLQLGRVLLAVFVAEQLYLLARLLVAAAFHRIGSEALRNEQKRRYMVRKTYLETFSEEAAGTSKRVRSKTYVGDRRSTASSPQPQSSHLAPVKPELSLNTGIPGNEKQPPREHSLSRVPPTLDTSHASPLLSAPSPTVPFPVLTEAEMESEGQGDFEMQEEPQYRTTAAERFWEEPEERGVDATEAGIRLILTLKRLQGQQLDQAEAEALPHVVLPSVCEDRESHLIGGELKSD